jgi:hypothetical protein
VLSGDTTELWPGHLGGSLCGGPGMNLKVSSTIGFERAHQALRGVARANVNGGWVGRRGSHPHRLLPARACSSSVYA